MDKYKRFDYSRLSIPEVFERLSSRPEGLSAAEARKRLQNNGGNLIHAVPKQRTLFGGSVSTLVVLLLVLAAVLSLFLDDGGKIAIVLLVAALINAAFSLVLQRGDGAVDKNVLALQAAEARVLRGGKEQVIPARQLVLGDVVLLKQNDVVPADIRIFEEDGLIIDESQLTARHDSVRKFSHAINSEVATWQRHNLALLGTSVISGTASGVVTGAGNYTELGRIAYLAVAPPTISQPKATLNVPYGKLLISVIAMLAVILVATALYGALPLQTVLFFAICWLVALAPAALLPVKAANLAAAVSRLAKENVTIKKISAVQTLGNCQALLYDTASELLPDSTAFHEILIGKTTYAIEPAGLVNKGKVLSARSTKNMSLLFTAAALSSGHRITATEKALSLLAELGKLDAGKILARHEEFKLFPYDAGRRLHSTVRDFNGQTFVFAQGAPDVLLDRSKELWDSNHVRKLSKGDKALFLDFQARHRKAGSQVVALAYRILPAGAKPHELTPESAEDKLIFIGLAAMATPLQNALPQLLQASTQTKLPVTFITDFNPTAAAAAAEALLPQLQRPMSVLTREDLTNASDGQLSTLLLRGNTLFCQISYEDKLRLVEILQRRGLSVAISGDGLYDAPALARADCGIAGGQNGLFGAAGVQLNGQGFAGLVDTLDISRQTKQNFSLMLRCILTTTAGKLLLVLLSLMGLALFHVPAVIGIVPLLAIDMIALAFPLAALSWNTPSESESVSKLDLLFTRESIANYLKFGLLAAGLAYLTFLAFFAYVNINPTYIDNGSNLHTAAATLAFLTFALCESLNVIFLQRTVSKQVSGRFAFGFICSLFLIVTIIYNPLVQPLAGTDSLQTADWLIAALAAALYVTVRLAQRHTAKHTRHEVIKLHKEIHGPNSPARI